MGYSEYLETLVGDVGNAITGTFNLLEFILGIIYLCGQTLAGWITFAGTFLVETFSQTSQVVSLIGSELWDFGGGVIRGLLLIYYSIWMIFESFYIISMDLKSFAIHVFTSIGQLCGDAQEATIGLFPNIFSTVPQHILESLVLIGEQTLGFFQIIFSISIDFVTQIFMAPIKVIHLIALIILRLGQMMYQTYESLPISAHVGLVVVILMGRLYWKISIAAVGRQIFRLLKFFFLAMVQTFAFIRNSRQIVFRSRSKNNSMNSSKMDTKALCVICQDETVSFISIPCKHVCLCYTCVKALVDIDNRCPLCRGEVTKFERVYIPL